MELKKNTTPKHSSKMITRVEHIDFLLQSKNLRKLEEEFYRRYRGIVPDREEYNKALEIQERYEDKAKTRWCDKEKSYVETSAGRHLRVAKFKCLLIDAIITLRHHHWYFHRDQIHHSRFCIEKQLAELN